MRPHAILILGLAFAASVCGQDRSLGDVKDSLAANDDAQVAFNS